MSALVYVPIPEHNLNSHQYWQKYINERDKAFIMTSNCNLVYADHHNNIMMFAIVENGQLSRDGPRICPYVPVVSRITWLSSDVPEYSLIAQMGV